MKAGHQHIAFRSRRTARKPRPFGSQSPAWSADARPDIDFPRRRAHLDPAIVACDGF
ncbi:hypothetical protein SLG_30950 [Sphingobium sp. SYK-6]|nr:hypothetical protein SLG_30950 [Sphingobium sp. SYK-6]